MHAILTDLDRTLTGPDLMLDEAALDRIRSLRANGIRIVVVTGRRLDEIVDMGIVPKVDAVVAENGAVIVSGPRFTLEVHGADWRAAAESALGRKSQRFAWGRVVASAPREIAEETTKLLARRRVEHALSFNADEVMILPPHVDKASGARRALAILGATPEEAWAIGDGENDVPMLELARLSAAPANAHATARDAADVLLTESYSRAFVQLTEPLVR